MWRLSCRAVHALVQTSRGYWLEKCSALHGPLHRAASVIAPHCISLGRTQPSARLPAFWPRLPPSGVAGEASARSLPPPIQKRKAAVLQQKHHGLLFPETCRPLRARPISDAQYLFTQWPACLLYTYDAADDLPRVDLGQSSIINTIKTKHNKTNNNTSRHTLP